MLRLTNIDEWQISKDETGRRLRDADSDSDPEMNFPLEILTKRCRHERETSEDEEDIPLLELRNMLRHRGRKQGQDIETRDEHMGRQDEGLSGPNDFRQCNGCK